MPAEGRRDPAGLEKRRALGLSALLVVLRLSEGGSRDFAYRCLRAILELTAPASEFRRPKPESCSLCLPRLPLL